MMRRRERRRIVLFVYWLGHDGGMEQHTIHLARALAERGDDVTIGYVDRLDDGAWLHDEDFRAVDLRAQGTLRRYALPGRARELAGWAHVVHCNGWDASAWGRLAAVAKRRPVIVTDHRPVAVRGGRREMNTAYKLFGRFPARPFVALHNRVLDRLTFATVAVARSQVDLLRAEGIDANKIAVIPNGIPLDTLRCAALAGVTRADLGIPERATVVLQIGRFFDQKRQHWSYDAVRTLRSELGDVRLVFAGDGPLRAALEERARADGADWALFLGQRPDIPRLLSLSDLAVLPSSAEALPMAMLEALAVGVPQVATDVGDVAAVLRAGAGLVVPADDQRAFTQACRAVLGDDVRARSMRGASLAAADAFSLERMTDAYEQLFDEAAAGPQPLPLRLPEGAFVRGTR